MTIVFTEQDRKLLLEYLEEKLRNTALQAKPFAANLFEAAQDPDCALVLREWLNRKTRFTDICEHGFSLIKMANCYPDFKMGVLMALQLIWLERHSEEHRGIAAFAGEVCAADWEMIERGEFLKTAFHEPDGWYLFGENRDIITDPDARRNIFADYDLWPLLADAPELIPCMAEPVGTCIYRGEDGRYTIYHLPEETSAEESN